MRRAMSLRATRILQKGGLNHKPKKILFSKNASYRRRFSTNWSYEVSQMGSGRFLWFFRRNIHFNAVRITFRSFLEPFETFELLNFGSHWKELNCSAPLSPLTSLFKSKTLLYASILGKTFKVTWPRGAEAPFAPPWLRHRRCLLFLISIGNLTLKSSFFQIASVPSDLVRLQQKDENQQQFVLDLSKKTYRNITLLTRELRKKLGMSFAISVRMQ